ncbi:MAG: prepilin peptidase [Lachnospiraceae bacterium]|nr:prepilin peptidase [Lachnospiraceae bacterium]
MVLLAALLFFAAVWDLWKKKIPNLIICTGYVLGLARLMPVQNMETVSTHFMGMILPILICIPLYLIGALGAGDIKLLSMAGFFLPVQETLHCLFLSFVLAGIISLIFLIQKKLLISRLGYAGRYILDCLKSGRLKAYYPPGDEGRVMRQNSSISFALPIFISTLIVLGGN